MSSYNLLIVESPAKAKTIKNYLGSEFDVIASMGHVRDLPKNSFGVDLVGNFNIKYENLRNKSKTIKEIKNKASKSSKIFLATDPDREGESIAWHLAQILNLDFNLENRVTFNEITKSAINNGINNPRRINNMLVDSQQARRVLDRIVGYKISPFLCQKIQRGLSAGRVQSVALQILVERENEIKKFVPKEYWNITAILEYENQKFKSIFYGKEKKINLENKQQAQEIIKNLDGAKYVVSEVKNGKKHKKPYPPFITSTLQQDAAIKFGFSSKKTMKIAQELYEGLNIEKFGFIGLITYMRTDSTRISDEARKISEDFILNKWGKNYLPSKRRLFKTKSNSQDAHEAIRPTMPNLTPDEIRSSLSNDQFKIYKLIWSRFIASQMSDCIQNTVNIKILANEYIFKSSGCSVDFDGFTILYPENNNEENILPNLIVGNICNLIKLEPSQHFTEPPPRFNEASLIKTLEGNGVGRPSTYSSIISTICSREYVSKESKNFVPTELGIKVNDLISKFFSSIINVKFTSDMELNLDKIEKGEINWKDVLSNFYSKFEEILKNAKSKTKGLKVDIESNKTDIICDKCGKLMVIKKSKFGKFIGCSGYPKCRNIKKIVDNIGVKCYKCGGDIIKRKSKFGNSFYGCSNFPNCDFTSREPPTGKFCSFCNSPLFLKKNKIFCKNCNKEEK